MISFVYGRFDYNLLDEFNKQSHSQQNGFAYIGLQLIDNFSFYTHMIILLENLKISQRIKTISLLLDKKSDKILIYNLVHESQRLLTKNRAPGFDTQIDKFKNLLHTQKAKATHIFKDP